jgi:hypothetical protein
VDIRAQFFKECFHARLREDYNVIDVAQRRHQKRPGPLLKNRPARSLQSSRAVIGIDGNNENVPLAFRAGKIANMADVQRIEASVRQNDAFSFPPEFRELGGSVFASLNDSKLRP